MSLVQGDAIDLGTFPLAPDAAFSIEPYAWMPGGPVLALPTPTESSGNPSVAKVYPAVVVPATARYAFRLVGGAIRCGSPGHPCPSVRAKVLTRRSQPVALYVSGHERSGVMAAGDPPREDTIWVANLGSGTVSLSFETHQPWVSVSPATPQLSGPQEGVPPASATPIVVRITSEGPAGSARDSIDVIGLPQDSWNWLEANPGQPGQGMSFNSLRWPIVITRELTAAQSLRAMPGGAPR